MELFKLWLVVSNSIKVFLMKDVFDNYLQKLTDRSLKPKTIDGYRRFTYYFIEFLESKGYRIITELKNGDVLAFVTLICSERYQPTSLRNAY